MKKIYKIINQKILDGFYWIENVIKYYLFYHKKSKIISRKYSFPKNYGGIYHYHIRKTGGTSLNKIMLQVGGKGTREEISNNRY